ncbi:hypothetical protein SAMN04515667_1549 [Formosa sp. Hel1_31_208]|uniref:hypothetical protein n=1 Tax=Formosa sp. Hel1_31_208 TaxID=1798225 RepID=UPI00087D1F57|nr:hypothetical protein [Formosa sp. Hel1_31_208]SDS16244.1 hypothetical protein SAMN04515667_1549 [Formosa sp. Hel1_31_208]
MIIDLARVIIDFGLVILIWMVQLTVYPSFKHYSRDGLLQWHSRYTKNIAIIVMPLMFGQLIIYFYQVFVSQNLFSILGLTIVILLWVSTFVQFVPLHQQINGNQHTYKTLVQLIMRNWIRTILWSALFLWSLIEALQL